MIRLIVTIAISNMLSCIGIIVLGTLQIALAKFVLGITIPSGLSAIRADLQAANTIRAILLTSMMESAIGCGFFAGWFSRKQPLLAGLFSSAFWIVMLYTVPSQGIGSKIDSSLVAVCYYSVIPLGLFGAFLVQCRGKQAAKTV